MTTEYPAAISWWFNLAQRRRVRLAATAVLVWVVATMNENKP